MRLHSQSVTLWQQWETRHETLLTLSISPDRHLHTQPSAPARNWLALGDQGADPVSFQMEPITAFMSEWGEGDETSCTDQRS